MSQYQRQTFLDICTHWNRFCQSNLPSHLITTYWHCTVQAQQWRSIARLLAGQPLSYRYLSHRCNPRGERTPCPPKPGRRGVRERRRTGWLLVGRLTSRQHDSVSQGQICTDHLDRSCWSNLKSHPVTVYWHRAEGPSADTTTRGAWQGSRSSTNFEVTEMTRPGIRSTGKAGIEPSSAALKVDAWSLGQGGDEGEEELQQKRSHGWRAETFH